MAMNMLFLTRGWLVLELTDDSPLMLALAMLSLGLPMTFVSLIGGVLADRVPRKNMIIFAQTGNAVVTSVLATLDLLDVVQFWHVFVIGLANGTLMAFNMPSRQAIVSDIVPERRLLNAVALNNSGMNLTRIVAPAAAGLLIIALDTSGVLYLIVGLYVLSVAAMWRLRAGTQPKGISKKGMGSDIREGVSYALNNPTIRGLMALAFVAVIFGMSYMTLLPAWGREALDAGSAGLGLLLAVMGLGALVGTLILASMARIRRRGVLLIAACTIWGIALAIFSQSPSYVMAVPLLFLVGMVSAVFMSLNMTLIQLKSPPEVRGRVMSLSMMTFGLMPLGSIPFGAVAEWTETSTALLVSGLLLAVMTLALAFGLPGLRRTK